MPYYHAVGGEYSQKVKEKRGYLLESFAGAITPKKYNKYMIDSGAFSQETQGKKIDINDYISFLKKSKYEICVNLDIIGNAELTYNNQKYMEREGLNVLPVFHIGSPYKWLQKYIDEGYDYIGLGGIARVKNKKLRHGFLQKCFSIGLKNRGIKFHGLGCGTQLIKKFPFYSIDSANVLYCYSRRTCFDGERWVDVKRRGYNPNNMDCFVEQYELLEQSFKKNLRKNGYVYHKYFKGQVTMDEVLG